MQLLSESNLVNGGENCVHGKEGEEDHKNKEE